MAKLSLKSCRVNPGSDPSHLPTLSQANALRLKTAWMVSIFQKPILHNCIPPTAVSFQSQRFAPQNRIPRFQFFKSRPFISPYRLRLSQFSPKDIILRLNTAHGSLNFSKASALRFKIAYVSFNFFKAGASCPNQCFFFIAPQYREKISVQFFSLKRKVSSTEGNPGTFPCLIPPLSGSNLGG